MTSNDENDIKNVSNIRGITCENGVRIKEDDFSNMADGRHIGFVSI